MITPLNPDTPASPAAQPPTFRSELSDFWRCVRHPTLARRLRTDRHGAGFVADWRPRISIGRLFAWAGVLWVLNVFLLGPIAGAAAGAGGSEHRLDIHNIPWLMAITWAPLVEELVFRYGLRRPLQALWFVPVMAVAMVWGPRDWTGLLVASGLLLAWWSAARGRPANFRWRRRYSRYFGWVFHISALTFAGLHLENFSLGSAPYWLLPLMVLPQWATGLVLCWMRVRRGIGASVALHALFNAGPIAVIAFLVHYMPQLAT